MTEKTLNSPHVSIMAEKVLADIRRRGLATGDRYLTTDQVSSMLGIHKGTANKALRFLADHELLVRRQRSGTFVGPRFTNRENSRVQTVYVLLPAGPITSRWSQAPFVEGIHRAIARLNVQFSFIPERDSVGYVHELIDAARSSGQLVGVIAISCPPGVYRYLAENQVPAVVYGTLYSKRSSLASVDMDNRASGRLLAQYLLDRGHRRIALLIKGVASPGDNDLLNGINSVVLSEPGAIDALVNQFVPNDFETVEEAARDLLDSPDRPTAIVTVGKVSGELAHSVARKLHLSVPKDLEIVFTDEGQTGFPVDTSVFTYVKPKRAFIEIAELIAGMFKRQAENKPLEQRHVVIPVELCQRETK